MTQEEKNLLLRDLSSRLPYDLLCQVEFKDGEGYKNEIMTLDGIFKDGECHFITETGSIYSRGFKPYLRPMLSMTERENKEYDELFTVHVQGETYCENWEWMDFMNSHHFDYRGLIDKGLALPAIDGMYE